MPLSVQDVRRELRTFHHFFIIGIWIARIDFELLIEEILFKRHAFAVYEYIVGILNQIFTHFAHKFMEGEFEWLPFAISH